MITVSRQQAVETSARTKSSPTKQRLSRPSIAQQTQEPTAVQRLKARSTVPSARAFFVIVARWPCQPISARPPTPRHQPGCRRTTGQYRWHHANPESENQSQSPSGPLQHFQLAGSGSMNCEAELEYFAPTVESLQLSELRLCHPHPLIPATHCMASPWRRSSSTSSRSTVGSRWEIGSPSDASRSIQA